MSALAYVTPQQCAVCGSELRLWRRGVEDNVYGVAGQWNLVRCTNAGCGAAYLDARLTSEGIGAFYATYSTHADPVIDATGAKRAYRETIAWLVFRQLGYPRPAGSRWLAALARLLGIAPLFNHSALSRVFWLPHVPHGRIVEIGFGNAQALLILRDFGWDVSGIEFDDVCIAKARALGLNVSQGQFDDQPIEDGTLDAVVGSHVIEHVPDPAALMATVHARLRPGGRMVLVTPNAASLGASWMGDAWRGLETPRHLTLQTPGSLTALARKAGFTKVRVFGTPLGGGIWQQSWQIRRKRKPGRTGRVAQLAWALVASTIHLVRPLRSDEIVLVCEK